MFYLRTSIFHTTVEALKIWKKWKQTWITSVLIFQRKIHKLHFSSYKSLLLIVVNFCGKFANGNSVASEPGCYSLEIKFYYLHPIEATTGETRKRQWSSDILKEPLRKIPYKLLIVYFSWASWWYLLLLKTGTLDNAIEDFWLAWPLWYTSQHQETMAAGENRFAPELNDKEVIELLENATPGSIKKVWRENISR